MNISETFIQRPIATSLLMAGIALFGVIAYNSLPVSDLPQVDYPTITVNASLPGANPDTMASAVATPLERQFTTIAGLDSMISNSGQGSTQHHPAVRPEPRHRRRHRGRGDRHRRGHAAAAARHADAAFVPQGESRRLAHHQPVSDIAHHAPLRPGRVCRDHGGAAHLHGGRRGAGAGVRLRQVRRARAGGPQRTGSPRHRPERSGRGSEQLERQHPHRHALRAEYRLQRAGERPVDEGGQTTSR